MDDYPLWPCDWCGYDAGPDGLTWIQVRQKGHNPDWRIFRVCSGTCVAKLMPYVVELEVVPFSLPATLPPSTKQREQNV